MSTRGRSEAIRRTILELVGQGRSTAEIKDRLGVEADERDLRYAASLVKVRDEVRSEKLQTGFKPAAAGA